MNGLTDFYTLSNGLTIPWVGFGTWQTPDDEIGVMSVVKALEYGYRHIDTAAIYGNEASVGKAIKDSGIPRNEIFVTSKVWNDDHGYEATLAAFDRSLALLDMDYMDLYLIHWPNPPKFRDQWEIINSDTWRAMEALYKSGKVKAIGVSNFRPHHLEELIKTAEIVPMVNQIRLCPGETQDATVEFCKKHNILLEAYSPFGTGRIFEVPEMKEIAEKYNKSVAQVCLRWSLQRGYLPLPKSITPERIKANTDIFDFELSEEDVQKMADMKGVCGVGTDPDLATF